MEAGQVITAVRMRASLAHVVYVGVDPGASGGLAVISGEMVECIPMPVTPREIWDWFSQLRTDFQSSTLIGAIEQVGGYAPNRRNDFKSQPGSAMFKFGYSAGGLMMAMIASGIIPHLTPPKRWQKFVGCSGNGESKQVFKNRLKERARDKFPETRGITLKTADALLLAYYCKYGIRRVK